MVYNVPNLIKKYPNMKAIVWFGEDKEPDPNALEILEESWAIRDFAHYGVAIAEPYFLTAPTVDELGRLVTTLGEFKQAVLLQNFPNPFNSDTWVPYRFNKASPVRIKIYNMAGYTVRILNLGVRKPGDYIIRQTAAHWDGKNENGDAVASRIYFYQLSAGNFSKSRKMLLLK